MTFANFFFVHSSKKSTKIKQFSNELADIDVWCNNAIKVYSRCKVSLSGPPWSVKLGETKKRDVTYIPSFYWAISSDPASVIDSFTDVNKRYGVRYFYLWFDSVLRENDEIKKMVHDQDVFVQTTRAEAREDYDRILFSLVMLKKHISLYKIDKFKNYSDFSGSDKKLDDAFMRQLEAELKTKLPRWG